MFDCCKELKRSIMYREFQIYPQYRGVCCYYYRENDNEYGQYFLRYCPFCGAKMPKLLYIDENGDDIYIKAIEEALGKEFCDITEDEIPEEFKTDEWWKKRGL